MADKARVAILISGRGSNMKALIDAKQDVYRIALVASNNPEAPGLAYAKQHGIATWAQSHQGLARPDFDRRLDAALRGHDAEVIALAGYMRLLSPAFIADWEGRILNIHPSLLPLYKGLDTHARALAAGDTVHGCSVHIVTADLDAGPVIARAQVPVLSGDTPESLAKRVLAEEHRLYPKALSDWVKA